MLRMTRTWALAAGIGLALASVSYTPMATAQVVVTLAPPPPRFERVPPPRAGYEWAPGYWQWNPGWHRHVWVTGHWIAARPGWRWRTGYWGQYRGGWRWHEGYWAH